MIDGRVPVGTRQLASRALGRVGARAGSSLAFGVTLALVARLVTSSEFGTFMLAYSIGLAAGIFAGVGAPTRVLRAGTDRQPSPGSLYVVHSALVAVSGALLGLAYWVLAPHPAVYAGLLLALGDSFVNYTVSHMTAVDRHRVANLLLLWHRGFVLLVVGLEYLVVGRLSFTLLAMALCVQVVVALCIPMSLVLVRESLAQWRHPFTGGLGYWSYSMSALLGQLQIPVLAAVTSATTVANYSIAAKVIGPISILTASVSVVAVPELAKRIESPARFQRLFHYLLGLAGIYLALLALSAWPIAHLVLLVVGSQYVDATPIIIAMVIGAGLSGCSQAFNSRLLALGRPSLSSTAIMAGAVAALGLLAALGSTGLDTSLWVVPVAAEVVVVGVIAVASWSARPASAPPRHTRVVT
ncbi:hypothetical protein H7K45_15555 [Mycobacterium yunnanensis]|uniref:Uncharacterized protein n=1 Tax=Mycobacterium yunnanensis TaxID=368477 RepID=A0A9X2Z349_9MYCO|nr:hypothetical protein [Mycobacterium yunnanensis]MCV7421965.1 hypothetical protein [Mycobacterium yunnanensis]